MSAVSAKRCPRERTYIFIDTLRMRVTFCSIRMTNLMSVIRLLFVLWFVVRGVCVDVSAIDDDRWERCRGPYAKDAVKNHNEDAHRTAIACSVPVLHQPSQKGTLSITCRTRKPVPSLSSGKADNVRALVSVPSPKRLREPDFAFPVVVRRIQTHSVTVRRRRSFLRHRCHLSSTRL